MSEKIDINKIGKLHTVGLKGIFGIVLKHNTFKKWPFVLSILVSLLCCIFISFKENHIILTILQSTSDLLVSVFPGLLGFSLGGYAIVVGFSNTDLIKNSSDVTKHSIYQILNGIFSLSILFQALVTILGVLIAWCIKVNLNSIIAVYFSDFLTGLLNIVILFFMFTGSLYSLLLTPYIIKNLFTLSQLNSLHYTIEKMKEEE